MTSHYAHNNGVCSTPIKQLLLSFSYMVGISSRTLKGDYNHNVHQLFCCYRAMGHLRLMYANNEAQLSDKAYGCARCMMHG